MSNQGRENIIFHLPFKINTRLASGSQIRPVKMLNAFKELGYSIDVVTGNSKERRASIRAIRKKIKAGVRYSFIYSESSTMPTLMTDSHHIPVAPILDFSFLQFCRNNGIKVGLFYRDIYWSLHQFPFSIYGIKKRIAKLFYYFDLYMYQHCVDVLYVPTMEMYEFLDYDFRRDVFSLPPGCENKLNVSNKNPEAERLNLFYVGGIGKNYDLKLLFESVSMQPGVHLDLCFRESDWSDNCRYYGELPLNIKVHHKSGDGLDELYSKTDVAVYFIEPTKFGGFALGLKLFEYMSQGKPIIAVKNTAIGNFVERNGIGWAIEYTLPALSNLISKLKENPKLILEKTENIPDVVRENTWLSRAIQVAFDLSRSINVS